MKAAQTRTDLAALFAAPGFPSPLDFSVQIDAEKPDMQRGLLLISAGSACPTAITTLFTTSVTASCRASTATC
jgi:hypothetical protein